MNKRSVEFASALLLVVSTTFGCAKQTSTLEFNAQARAMETAKWQDGKPQAVYLGSVIINPDPGLNVRSFPRRPLFDPDNKIVWRNIIRINGLEIKYNKFLVKYPTLVYDPNIVKPGDLINPNNAPWIQLDAQVRNDGRISNQKVYISFSDDPRSYMQTEQSSNSQISKLIASVSIATDGVVIDSTSEVIPTLELSQISVCGPDNPCSIPQKESAILARQRLLRRIQTSPYKYSLIQGDGSPPGNSIYNGNFFVDRDTYLRYGQNKIQMPISFVLRAENDSLHIALSDSFKKDVVFIGRAGGQDLCAPNSPEKTEAYEALLDNFSQNSVVDIKILLALTQDATSCKS